MPETPDFNDPATWLDAVKGEGFVPPPTRYTHPDDPNFHERVMERAAEVRVEHQLVTTLAELRRKGAAITQTELARRWGRAQSRVSSLEADITRPEVSTLIEYVQALGGTLEIRVTVNDHTYIEQLV